MLEILGKTNIDFMGKRKYAFAFSGFMVLLGLVALVQIGRGAANLGIDFAGARPCSSSLINPFISMKCGMHWSRTV